MNIKLKEQLEKLTTPPSANYCFAVHSNEWVERPNKDFMDTDFHLPSINRMENGYKSNTLVVLTSRHSMQGRLLNACLGYMEVRLDGDYDYQNQLQLQWRSDDDEQVLQWRSDDGEQVVGWMPVPVFHVDENTTLQQDTSKHQGFLFGYAK